MFFPIREVPCPRSQNYSITRKAKTVSDLANVLMCNNRKSEKGKEMCNMVDINLHFAEESVTRGREMLFPTEK